MTDRRGMLSMTRRVALTVAAAMAAVFLVLFAWLWHQSQSRETGEMERSLLQTANYFVASLEELDSESAASALVALFRHAQAQAPDAGEPPLHLALSRLDGRSLQTWGPVTGLDLRAAPVGFSTQEVGGVSWRLYCAASKGWKVAIVDNAPVRQRVAAWSLFTDLLRYVGLALPLVLGPVWLMARASLKPLRELTDRLAARSPLDTRPLPSNERWKELAPLERALNQLFERTAQGLAREKAFVHDAAHELRTPLAVVSAQAHVLATSVGPEARAQASLRLQAAVTRASHLAQQLLLLARADAAARFEAVPVDLMNLARDAMALQAERAAAQGTDLDLTGPDHVPLQGDPRALRSIIDNLLDNALRYGGPGGTVRVQVQALPGVWCLIVSDEGPGIRPADREQVFERFWRGSGHNQPGSGLGLAIVREAARAMAGEACVVASAAGATVQVRLPAS